MGVFPNTNTTHLPIINNKETLLQDFLQNYLKILKKCFLNTTWTVMLSTYWWKSLKLKACFTVRVRNIPQQFDRFSHYFLGDDVFLWCERRLSTMWKTSFYDVKGVFLRCERRLSMMWKASFYDVKDVFLWCEKTPFHNVKDVFLRCERSLSTMRLSSEERVT